MVLSLVRVLVFAILMLFGSCLLHPPGVFVSVTGIWVLPDNFVPEIGHGLEVSVIGILSLLDCGSVHMLQLWVSCLAQQVSNLGMLGAWLCLATSAHSGMVIVKFMFKFSPTHVRLIFTSVVQILEGIFGLNELL